MDTTLLYTYPKKRFEIDSNSVRWNKFRFWFSRSGIAIKFSGQVWMLFLANFVRFFIALPILFCIDIVIFTIMETFKILKYLTKIMIKETLKLLRAVFSSLFNLLVFPILKFAGILVVIILMYFLIFEKWQDVHQAFAFLWGLLQ